MAKAPDGLGHPQGGEGDADGPGEGEARDAFDEAFQSRRSHDPAQVWPWQRDRLVVASPVIRDGDVIAVVVTDSPTGQMRSKILRGWLVIGVGEVAAMLLALSAALRLTGWVLRPVRVLDATTHDIATGRLKSRVAVAGGPPELRRLARSFNEMADNVEDVLEQQRAFVADASHQLRNPLSALLLRIELLALELPEGNEEIASVRTEGKRLAQVLDDLLDLALAEHAEADLRLTDIGELTAERVASWSPVADDKGVRLVGTCPATTALGRSHRALQRPGRGDRQRAEVHTRGKVRRGRGGLQRRGLVHRRHAIGAPASVTRNSPASAIASGAAPATRTSRAPASACPSPGPCWRRAAAPSRTSVTSRTD